MKKFRKKRIGWLLVIVFVLVGFSAVPGYVMSVRREAVRNLAPTPPMGWNGWNHFRCSDEVNEQLIRETVDALVASGMKDVGYSYVVLDDCWQVARDEFGHIVPDLKKFPGGMRALGDYIHGRGLKFGIYTSAGRTTCEKRSGSFGFERNDVKTYASWGVDYIKVDWCGIEYLDTETQYKKWRKAIEQSGRPMVLSIAIADIEKIPYNNVWQWGRGIGHLWRTTVDILDYYPDILRIIDQNSQYARYGGPNGWNDADMLQVGNGGMTIEEYKTHFSMWAMMASPLFAGNDVRNMKSDIKDILTNKEIIAVNQDILGKQATKIVQVESREVWLKPLYDSRAHAVAVLNRLDDSAYTVIEWKQLGLTGKRYLVRDLWKRLDDGIYTDKYEVVIPAHGTVVLLLKNYDL